MIKKLFTGFIYLIMLGCVHSQESVKTEIKPGIYFTNSYLSLLNGKSVAVVANKTSKIENINLIDTLLKLSGPGINFKLKAIFTPEHGFSGTYDAGAKVDNEKQAFNAIKVISLYGKKKKPDSKDLESIELVLFDLQDVGVRFYTYLSTLHYVMQACAENKIPLIILDRPNPNGFYIDGPIMEEKFSSFVGLHPVPVVYGMTIGEYARMINGEGWLGKSLKCELTVIPIDNYTHKSKYILPDKPSPNLPNMQSVYLYPSLCFFEGTIVSVGRGTNFPFQVIGHPDFNDKSFSFTPKSITGASVNPPFEGKICYGLDLRSFSSDTLFNKQQIQLEYLFFLYKELNKKELFFNDYFDYLAGNNKLRKQILAGVSETEIRRSWEEEIDKFKKIRVKYLLYPD
jgi:uncharacterized protein YbbC (DUF1343 family)